MKIPITIEKETAEDCSYSCTFRNDEDDTCCLFNQRLEISGYYYSRTTKACWRCQRLFEDSQTPLKAEGGVQGVEGLK